MCVKIHCIISPGKEGSRVSRTNDGLFPGDVPRFMKPSLKPYPFFHPATRRNHTHASVAWYRESDDHGTGFGESECSSKQQVAVAAALPPFAPRPDWATNLVGAAQMKEASPMQAVWPPLHFGSKPQVKVYTFLLVRSLVSNQLVMPPEPGLLRGTSTHERFL